MEMKLRIELPFFPGFFESDLEDSDTFYIEAQENFTKLKENGDIPKDTEFDYDDYAISTDAYEQKCVELFIASFKERMPKFVKEIELAYIDKPNIYSFEDDKLYVDIVIDKDEYLSSLQTFINENEEWIKNAFDEHWTYEYMLMSKKKYDYDEWLVELSKEEIVDSFISSTIAFMMCRKNKNVYDEIIKDVLNNISVSNYVYYLP